MMTFLNTTTIASNKDTLSLIAASREGMMKSKEGKKLKQATTPRELMNVKIQRPRLMMEETKRRISLTTRQDSQSKTTTMMPVERF